METRFVLIIFIFQVIKKTSALALSASLEVLSASLLIIPIQAEALPERGYMLFMVNLRSILRVWRPLRQDRARWRY